MREIKTQIDRFSRIIELVSEMYQEDPKFFVDGFFDMYYKMKRKHAIDNACKGNPDLIKRTWSALNFFKEMVEGGKNPNDAAKTACEHYSISIQMFHSLTNKFKAFRSAKKTKFKNLL